jgi:hypothetical protein
MKCTSDGVIAEVIGNGKEIGTYSSERDAEVVIRFVVQAPDSDSPAGRVCTKPV